MRFRASHTCGTVVEDDLPEGYPVEEGVGLWCPACEEAFWFVGDDPEPAGDPVRAVPPATAAPAAEEPAPGPEPEPAAPVRRRRWRRPS